jgi:hypothetical protein
MPEFCILFKATLKIVTVKVKNRHLRSLARIFAKCSVW